MGVHPRAHTKQAALLLTEGAEGRVTDLRPLTERIIARLPGGRVLWIAAWALVPWLHAGANLPLDPADRTAVWDQSDVLIVLSYAAFSSAIVITIWGAERIARQLQDLRPTTSRVLEGDATEPFGAVNSAVGPTIAAAAIACAFAMTALVAAGWTTAVLRGTTWFVLAIPIWTFLWTYASLQLGLDRLGRARLRPDAARVDPTLGLRPLGRLAFTGLWLLLAWLVPLVLTSLPDVVGVVVGALVLCAALAAFFFSLYRLHRQMVEVKEAELVFARDLYAQAYEPVRTVRSLDALDRQRQLLGAADGLEKRAQAIHEWPLDEGTVARVITITTSVIAVVIARLILDPLGL